ncbi:o-succinylbenzoate--CoA ligase [Sporosarcina sp. ANT_H38]|uniref:o-succinylbenzoate--CoA ligase n=1 Tax=Sporosarcina sp. ANT_H38 TaxID=2597358 RepID=UPI0011F346E2|nr:o-succinylbenzoate--CoA ligase [Sporosarcina sp. ANT_H38]KAA0964791.1 o-succinylbenzoate--CoA ligase [Sporosarcina sp. ANT_H38]
MIPNWLMQRAYLTPEKTALSFEGEKWTFAQLKLQALTLAGKLKANGLNEGHRIALLGPSNAEMVFIIHACMLAGLEIVMLNSRLTKKEIAYQLDDSGATMVIVSDELSSMITDSPVRQLLFSAIQDSAEHKLVVQDTWPSDKTITIMYTSGTTGFPKGVRQTAGNHVSSALSSVLNLGLDENDIWLCAMPLFHISGFSILVRSVLYGMEVQLHEKFDAVQSAKAVGDGSVTRMSVVSLTLDKVLRELENGNRVAHSSFKSMLAGGGPVPIAYLNRAKVLGVPVLQTYGMTETSSQTATLAASDAIRKMGSAGKPLFFNQIKIKGTKTPDEKGEVCIRGPHVTPGYIGRFAELEPLEDGWLPTGDIGYLDFEGYLYIVDRRSDLIISGGENIYPAEIENVLAAHPNVREAGVCGKEHPEWGSVPIAFVVVLGTVTEADLMSFCEKRLARYKVPKSFHFVDELPRNGSNKLLRRKLKELLDWE